MNQGLPNRIQVLASLTPPVKVILHQHFQGAADPDHLIYMAWLFANGWLADSDRKYSRLEDCAIGEVRMIEVLDISDDSVNAGILYDLWRMGEVLDDLKFDCI